MSYRISICDDSSADTAYLVRLVHDWSEKNEHTVFVQTYPSAENFLFRREEDSECDILLLDIEMGSMNGVELAKELRKSDMRTQIVFITGYPDFISDGYDVSALHYLMKPVPAEKLSEVLTRAVNALATEKPFLFISSSGAVNKVYFDSITYAESQGHYVIVHTDKTEYKVRMTVPELSEKLGEGFYRCSRSYIVSLKAVHRVTKSDVYLKDGSAVPLGRGQYKDINQTLIRYLRTI